MLALFNIVLFLAYPAWIDNRFGAMKSISISYYKLSSKKYMRIFCERNIFQWWVAIIATFTAFAHNSAVMYFSASLMFLVVFYPTVKNSNHLIWHMIGAFGSMLTAMVYLGLFTSLPWHSLIYPSVLILLMMHKSEHKIYVAEMVVGISVQIFIIIDKLSSYHV